MIPVAMPEHEPFGHVAQFANVARPGYSVRWRIASALMGATGSRMCVGVLLEKVVQEYRDVFSPFAQRRHFDVDDVQAVVQILAERPLRRSGPPAAGASPR